MLDAQAVNVLLMASADVRLKCNTGGDVLQYAAESGCHEVFERILEVRMLHASDAGNGTTIHHCWD